VRPALSLQIGCSGANALVPYAVSGLVYWLDPERYDDPTAPWTMNGTKVASAPSRESAGGVIDTTKTATQATDAQRPTLNTADAAYGGRRTMTFVSASAQRMFTGTFAALSNPYTLYVVGQNTDTAGTYHYIDGQDASNRIDFFTTTTSLGIQGTAPLSSVRNATTDPFVACGVFNGASSAFYVNGSSVAEASGNTGSGSVNVLRIGEAVGSVGRLNGKIATILVYSGAHDAATRALIMGWLEDRYGFNRSLTPYLVGGLAYWLDPDRYADGSGPGAWTMNSTKVVTAVSRHAWNGVADTSKNATQATDAQRPTINLADAGYNGRNTLSFAAASTQFLTTSAWTNSIAHPLTTYVVASVNSFAAARTFIDSTPAPTAVEFFSAVTSGIVQMNSNATQIGSAAGAITAGTNYVLGAVWNGASSSLYLSNASSAAYTGTLAASTLPNIRIGASVLASLPMDGKIVTVLVYSGAHTTAQRQFIMGYLGARYGVAVTL
jgi:hypothetical protein